MKRRLTERRAQNLRDLAEFLRKNPSRYDQDTFGDHSKEPCGTTACIAGWAALNAGYKPTVIENSYGKFYDYETLIKGKRDDYDVNSVGEGLLGTHEDGYMHLFSGSWLPKGYDPSKGRRHLANRVAEALEGLAEGKSLTEVSA